MQLGCKEKLLFLINTRDRFQKIRQYTRETSALDLSSPDAERDYFAENAPACRAGSRCSRFSSKTPITRIGHVDDVSISIISSQNREVLSRALIA